MLKAIETTWMGCRFRSRLEARHAVLFEELGVRWEYEAEGYDLQGTCYLPDFWMPDQQCFIEIKGDEPNTEERRKAQLLAEESGKSVLIFSGSIHSGMTGGLATPAHGYFPDSFWWGECDKCKRLDLVAIEAYMRVQCPVCQTFTMYRPSAPRLRNAYDAARAARFEHGETPIIRALQKIEL